MKLDSKEIYNYLNSTKYDFKLFNMHYTDPEKETISNFTLEKSKTFNHFGSLETLENINLFLSEIGTNNKTLIKKMEKVIINIIKKVLKGYQMDHFWLTIRVTQPNHDFDIPRWHKDGSYFLNDPDEKNSAKFAIALKGPGTLLIKKTKETINIFNETVKEERKEHLKYAQKNNFETMEEKIKLSIKISDKFRPIYAKNLAKQKVIKVLPNQGLVFYAGFSTDNCAIHSEPKLDQPRMFISILPSTEINIKELKKRWNR